MVRSYLPKAALLLVLILLLATPVAQAAERGTHQSPAPGMADVFARAWDFLTRVWANNGCGLDPDGRCVPEPNATPEADNGCGLDPSGGCAH
jgi:hypothetical protein